MPVWLISLALGGMGKLRAAASWLVAHPAILGCVLLALYAAYERHDAHRWHSKADECHARYEAALKASDANAKAQADQKARVEAEYKAKAEKADDHFQTALANADNRVAAYIAAHRVRTGPAHISTAPASTKDQRAEVPAIATADPVVLEASDVKVCAADYTYARHAFEWAQSLGESK